MIECRSIIFSEHDLIEALLGYCRARGITLPSGTIRGATVDDTRGEQVTIVLTVVDDYGVAKPTSFDQANVGSALIHYCLDRGVRLPRAGTKSIQAFGQEVGLVIHQTAVPFLRKSAAVKAPSASGVDPAPTATDRSPRSALAAETA